MEARPFESAAEVCCVGRLEEVHWPKHRRPQQSVVGQKHLDRAVDASWRLRETDFEVETASDDRNCALLLLRRHRDVSGDEK